MLVNAGKTLFLGESVKVFLKEISTLIGELRRAIAHSKVDEQHPLYQGPKENKQEEGEQIHLLSHSLLPSNIGNPDSWSLGLRFNYANSFPVHPTCKQQTIGLLASVVT